MSDEKPIKKSTGKGGNYRKTKSGAGMTAKGVAAYRKANPGSKLKRAVKTLNVVNRFALDLPDK